MTDLTPFGLCPLRVLEGDPTQDTETDAFEIDGYLIIDRIGEGGFAAVFEVLQLQPVVRPAAIKRIHTTDQAMVRRLEDEMTILGSLHHPGIVPIRDAGVLPDGRAWFSMPLLEGVSFGEWLARSAPDLRTIAKVVKGLAEAMGYAHEKGVLHRDLKPSNIVMTPAVEQDPPEPVIIDFGLGKAQQGPAALGRETTVVGTWMGTPLYMAPEQMAGEDATKATDIHALGLLLAEGLIGRPAMESVVDGAADKREWMQRRAHWKWPVEPRSRMEIPLRWIAERALALSPEDRYATAREMAEDLRRWLEGRAVEAAGRRFRYRCHCLLRRHRRLAAVALLALVLGTGGWTAARLHWDRLHMEQLATVEAEAVHARALEDFRNGMGDRALAQLDAALANQPGNADLRFTARALRALAASAIRLPDVDLPFDAHRIEAVAEGWLIEDGDGNAYLVDRQQTVAPAEGLSLQSGDSGGPFELRPSPGARVSFVHPEDGLPVLQPIQTGLVPGATAVDWERRILGSVDGGRVLRRWDISMAGESREEARFGSPVPWMTFERNRPHLWMRHGDGRMRGWRLGEQAGPALPFPAFDVAIEKFQIGENHARGTRPGLDGLRMLAELAQWHRRHPADGIAAVAGARDVDHVAFGTNEGKLLFWTPETGMQEPGDLWGKPQTMAIDSTGRHLISIDPNGSVTWFDLGAGETGGEWQIDQQVVSASLLDAELHGTLPLLIIGAANGEVAAYALDQPSEPLWRIGLQAGKAANRPVQVHGLPGGKQFLAGIRGGYQLEVRQAASAEPDGAPFAMRNGLNFFFLSADGRIVVAVDQSDSGKSDLRLLGLDSRRDLIPPLAQPALILWACLAMDGGVLATATEDGVVRRWSLGSH